jgi:Tfp pilus assembly protein PilV
MKTTALTVTKLAPHPRANHAFTLLEVMIASGIFFMAIFAILALVSSNLRNARLLQKPQVDAGLLLADLCQTNQLTEGSDSGDFGEAFPGYTWTCDIQLYATNGLFKVDYIVTGPGGGPNSQTEMSAFLYRPDSPTTPGR